MYKIVINDKEIFSTDDKWEYVQYCIDNYMIHTLVSDILPENYEIKLYSK